jgi:hypothetical protein
VRRFLRRLLVFATAGVVLIYLYSVRFEGDLHAVDPVLVALLPAWIAQPSLLRNVNEPEAIYAVPGIRAADGSFEALRLDVKNGARSAALIRFGPGSDYRFFDSAAIVTNPSIELHGLSLRRPVFHLFVFPGPGGPGFDFVDSATGVFHVVAKTPASSRTLLTRTVINSRSLEEMKSMLWADRSRDLAAFLSRESNGWRLYLFSMARDQR